MAGGRPTSFNTEVADKICLRIMDGESLRSICSDDDMPHVTTVHKWLLDDSKREFFDQYTQARDIQAQTIFDECLDIADDGRNDWMTKTGRDGKEFEVVNNEAIQRSKLRVDTRMRMASVMAPKRYGDKKSIELTGKDGGAIHTKSAMITADMTDKDAAKAYADIIKGN